MAPHSMTDDYCQHEEFLEWMARNLELEPDDETKTIEPSSFLGVSSEDGSLKAQSQEEALSKESTGRQRTVSFSEVEIQHYPIILGDHPGVSSGPPLTIDWDPIDFEVFTLEDYERHNSQRNDGLRLSQRSRERYLKKWGYRKSEIKQVLNDIEKIKKSRATVVKKPFVNKNKAARSNACTALEFLTNFSKKRTK